MAYRLAADESTSDLIAFRRMVKDARSARAGDRPTDALTEPPNSDDIITVDRDGSHLPDPAEFGRRSQACLCRAKLIHHR